MNERLEENKQWGGNIGARQFIDLGKADQIADIDGDHYVESTSEETSHGCSTCPDNMVESTDYKSLNNNGMVPFDFKTSPAATDSGDTGRYRRECESSNHGLLGLSPTKLPKFDLSKDAEDLKAATMPMIRKARVSVKARCDASMVSFYFWN